MAMAAHSLSNFCSTFLSSKSTPARSPAAAPTLLPSSQNLRLSKFAHSGWAPLVATTTIPITDVEPTLSFSPFSSFKTASDVHYGDVLAMVCPSLAYANTLHYKSGYYNVQIKVEENEPEDRVINRFRRAVVRAQILKDCRRRRFFESTQDKKKRKVRDAARRNRKSRRPQPRAQGKQEAPKKKEDDGDGDDNWDLPEGDIPYC